MHRIRIVSAEVARVLKTDNRLERVLMVAFGSSIRIALETALESASR